MPDVQNSFRIHRLSESLIPHVLIYGNFRGASGRTWHLLKWTTVSLKHKTIATSISMTLFNSAYALSQYIKPY